MNATLPSQAGKLAEQHPQIWQAFQALGKSCAEAGPLDERTRRLIKLAIAVGGSSEGAVHSHVRQALDQGLSAEEIRHVALLAAPTLGFPAAVRALTWMDDILDAS